MTPFTRAQVKSAFQALSPAAQEFIHSNETADLILQLLVGTGFSEAEAQASPDSEILYAMYGLQTLDDAIMKIAALVNKNPGDLGRLKSALDAILFSRIPIGVRAMWAPRALLGPR